jgi:hypothetical protein
MNAEKSTNCRTRQNRTDLRMRAAYFASVFAKKAEVLA